MDQFWAAYIATYANFPGLAAGLFYGYMYHRYGNQKIQLSQVIELLAIEINLKHIFSENSCFMVGIDLGNMFRCTDCPIFFAKTTQRR